MDTQKHYQNTSLQMYSLLFLVLQFYIFQVLLFFEILAILSSLFVWNAIVNLWLEQPVKNSILKAKINDIYITGKSFFHM